MYAGVPTDPPWGARRPTPKVWVNQGGGGGYSPQNCRTPLGVTHWLAAAPMLGWTYRLWQAASKQAAASTHEMGNNKKHLLWCSGFGLNFGG